MESETVLITSVEIGTTSGWKCNYELADTRYVLKFELVVIECADEALIVQACM